MKLTTQELKHLSIFLQERKVQLYAEINAGVVEGQKEILESRIAFINATQDKIYFELYGEVA